MRLAQKMIVGGALLLDRVASSHFSALAFEQLFPAFVGTDDCYIHMHFLCDITCSGELSFSSGSSRAPSPMERALPRREHNFVHEQTDDDNDEHNADDLIHGI